MSELELTLAITEYDHATDLLLGDVRPEGVDLRCLRLPIEEIFRRFMAYREWDVSEFSLAKYASLVASGDDTLTAIPVFPARSFRHSAYYVRADSGFSSPADLGGRVVGVPEWAQTAGVYARSLLETEYSTPLTSIEWVQAGVDSPGRREQASLKLPDGIRLRPASDRSLNDLLLAGEIDALISARPPSGAGTGELVHLFADVRLAETDYYRRTGVFPIMHVIAIRRDSFEANRWIAGNLLNAFEQARRNSLARARDITASHFPLPWTSWYMQEAEEMFGPDLFPYGVDKNKLPLEAFLRAAHSQGVCERLIAPEDLFPVEVGGGSRA